MRHHLILPTAAATLLAQAACSGPPPAAEGNRSGSLGDPAAPAVPAPRETLAAEVPAAAASTPTQMAKTAADYAGKWIGPEGLVLDVRANSDGTVALTNQWTLDDKGRFTGTVAADGLHWTRGGAAVVARPSDGDATGMKWLAGKQDCLTVIAGSEGYCRA